MKRHQRNQRKVSRFFGFLAILLPFLLMGLFAQTTLSQMNSSAFTERPDPFEVLSCNPVAACFLSLIMEVVPIQNAEKYPVGPNEPIVWDQGPETPAQPPDERPPNIILILADDLGFNDVSFYAERDGRTPTIGTPAIDSLADEGVVFNNGYAGNATCAPSRAAIMTGRYGTRCGYEFTPIFKAGYDIFDLMVTCNTDPHKSILDTELAEGLPELEELGMPTSEITIAEKLKEVDYHTVHIGKWHLGYRNYERPNDQGFDESLNLSGVFYLPEDSPDVVNAYLDYDPIDMMMWVSGWYGAQFTNEPSPDPEWEGTHFEPDGYLTDYYTNEAVKVIEANRNRPFFLFLSHWGAHTPLQAKKSDYDAIVQAHPEITDHRLLVYMAMIKAVDRSVGAVMQALVDNGIDNNTLVIFTSDNGGAPYVGLPEINEPYRGWKLTFFEGGVHVPFFMRWPKEITAGTVYDKPVAHVDLFSTAAAAAGVSVPGDRVIDGVDLLPFVKGVDTGYPHDTLFWRSGDYQVVLKRDTVTGDYWKMQVHDMPDKIWLYNLTVDPTEQNNLADTNPTRVAELQAALDGYNAEQVEPIWPSALSGPVMVDKTQDEDMHVDDEYVYWQN